MSDPFKNILAPPTLPAIPRLPTTDLNPAEWMHERVVRSIYSFERSLDQDHEVGARLVTFGAELTFHIENVGYWGPDIITFHGVGPDGGKVELLQHISQLSVLLIAMRKTQDEPRRIGAHLVKQLSSK